MVKRFLLLFAAAAGMTLVAATKAGIRVEINGRSINADFREVRFSDNLVRKPTPWHKELSSSHILLESPHNIKNKNWQKYSFSFIPAQSGTVEIMLRGNATGKQLVRWIEYDKFSAAGTRMFNPSFEILVNDVIAGWVLHEVNMCKERKDAFDGKNFLKCAHDFSVKQDLEVTAGKKVAISFYARPGAEETYPAKTAKYSRKVKEQHSYLVNHPKEYYRVYNSKVKYLPLKDKGIRPDMIPISSDLVAGKIPEAEFITPLNTKLPAAGVKIPLEIVEESGVARTAEVRSGLPVAKNTLFNFNNIRVVDPAGKTLSAQFSAVGFWQDGSIKWVLVQFPVTLKANEKSSYFVEYGKTVKPYQGVSPLKFTDTADEFKVDTGVLSATVSKKHFALLQDVKVNGTTVGSFAPQGLSVIGENGEKFSSSAVKPEKFTILENGPRRLVCKISGKYAAKNSPGTYTVVIGFTAGSPVVDFAINHTNTNLNHEFTDITSLGMDFIPQEEVETLTLDNFTVKNGGQLFQMEEYLLVTPQAKLHAALTGTGKADSKNSSLTFSLADAAYRYPKAFGITDGKINFALLPELPDAKFGADLPYYLQFPFCEGKYRLKWGMGFTERLKIDFSGKNSPQVVGALDVIPVIDRDYLYATSAIPGVFPKNFAAFAEWDKAALEGFYAHMNMKKHQREYGFLNYGDWFGERGRNWTNNEYDLAHGLFMLFARTGNRDTFRWALAAARHQADVDIIHAYPDPYYIGANAQHGIGHTGMNHQRIYPGLWSFPVNYSFAGKNGHTWSTGMLDAWCFTGDTTVMDAALKLGEHLVRYTAPGFHKMSTHERDIGWSSRAMLALYQVTGQQKYLDAAKRALQVAFKLQRFDKGGAWPHKMPKDHSGGHKGAYGNTPFLIGVLISAIRDYHQLTGDPAAERSLIAAAAWQQRNWDAAAHGFPYALSWDHKPYFPPGYTLNCLVAPGISYRALLTGDKEGFEIAKAIARMETFSGLSPVGKNLSIRLTLAAELMDDIVKFSEKYPDAVKYQYDPAEVLKTLNKKKPLFNYRGPDDKEFKVVLHGSAGEITIERSRTGSRPQGNESCTVKIIAPDGKEITALILPTNKNYSGKFSLTGKKGDIFRVVINDDMTANWNIPPGKDHTTFAQVVKNSNFSNASPAVLYLTVPAGTRNFTVTIAGVHLGMFRAWLLRPDGQIAASTAGINDGTPLLPWLKPQKNPAQQMKISLPEASDKAEVWKLLVLTSGGMRLQLKGIPPYVSIVPALYPAEGK